MAWKRSSVRSRPGPPKSPDSKSCEESTYLGVILKDLARTAKIVVKVICAALDPFDFAQGKLFASSRGRPFQALHADLAIELSLWHDTFCPQSA
jgi:hypothetical protein